MIHLHASPVQRSLGEFFRVDTSYERWALAAVRLDFVRRR
jgi:hypothetical protein